MRLDRFAARFVALALALGATTAARAASWEGFFAPFLGDLRAEISDARAGGRKGVMVMYHFEECPYCQRMKRDVLSRVDVQQGFARNFVAIAIDTRGAQPVTGLDGKVRPENEHARATGIRVTPTFDFIATDGTLVYRHAGAIYEPRDFLLLGTFVAESAYRAQSFADYLRSQTRKGN